MLNFMRAMCLKRMVAATLPVVFLMSCAHKHSKPAMPAVATQRDAHTLSNADSIQVNHLFLDATVDFDKKMIVGSASWDVKNPLKLHDLRLDTYDLSIDSVRVDGKLVAFRLDQLVKFLGTALHIPITEHTTAVAIYYKTGHHATALQWLDPTQTHDKKHPFLYTQSESIYARSWIPCPDGPGIRFTYDARVRVPRGLLALMSAENPTTTNDSSVYTFRMDKPIPAYLMALAVGDITFQPIDSRTGVYAEPGMVAKARYEFDDVGKMVGTAEQLYGPYRWGRYDVIVLPPGFPIGGMENPRLTFCTPTIIAGDRSLVNLVAHELAHSWSGNLVTNATWNDFWLNEGFTNYFERRIMEQMMGKDYADMLWELGYADFESDVKDKGATSRDTWLKDSLNGRDPDDGFSDIPYEKGSHFLKLVENTVGRERFDKFLAKYFGEHAFTTMTTERFLVYLDSNLLMGDTALKHKIDIDAWVYGPGIPANCPRTHPVRFKAVENAAATFPVPLAAVKGWSTHEWLHYLHLLADTPTIAHMKVLDDRFHLTHSGNAEIADLWFQMAVKCNYQPAFGEMERFVSTVGRRKFLEPLYKGLSQTPNGLKTANLYFKKYRNNYHPLTQESIQKMLSKANGG